ncbi:MAG: hypothetical protein HKN67_13390 [Saprospiraceae bacterium]|nr:hypothetical protein [Bacteroidia bacterium]MBT8229713.1 hypothetical protein [Bacteroidia bacterium]NNF22927.1 hypothetical protein [Saprospiraceae bacterium]NNK89803.1 hypothetical protein [Saprospiraceae bacterium]
MKPFIYILLISAFFVHCKTHLHIPAEYKGDQVIFGKGGGFTGRVNAYSLLDNGNLFSNPGDSLGVKYIGRIKQSKADQIFKTYTDLGLDKQKMNSPGNMYSFIEMHINSEKNKVQWGSNRENPTPEMKQFFTNLMHIVKTMEKSNI